MYKLFFFSADKQFHSQKRLIHSLMYYSDVLCILGKPEPWLIMFKKATSSSLNSAVYLRAAVSPAVRSPNEFPMYYIRVEYFLRIF